MRIQTVSAGLIAAALAAGPLVAQNAAHAHIGHVADGWRDTPDGMGLLPAAQAEAEVALQHAGLAAGASGNLAGVQRHAGHVLHALDVEAAARGPGKGYGMLKAAQAARRHIELAAAADGASDNVKRHAEHVATSLANVVEWGEMARAHAREIQETDDYDRAMSLAQELVATLEKIVTGHDANGDGRTGWGPGEGGLAQASTHLNLMKRGEGLGS